VADRQQVDDAWALFTGLGGALEQLDVATPV
jgi:hypothetical protein